MKGQQPLRCPYCGRFLLRPTYGPLGYTVAICTKEDCSFGTEESEYH